MTYQKTYTKTEMGNFILESEDGKFFISFNDFKDTPDYAVAFLNFADHFSGVARQAETALCLYDKTSNCQYLVLNGDFRKEYEEVIDKGYEVCLEVYNKLKGEHRAFFSMDIFDNNEVTNDIQ